MERRVVMWPTPDGVAHGRLFLPDGGPAPLVVFCMDALGLRPALDVMAARFVDAGYAVVQPELYWRSGPYAPFDAATTFSDPAERARVMALMNALRPSDVIADVGALLDAIHATDDVLAGPVGVVGCCMGGRQALYLAGALGDRVAAMASIHGGGLVRPDATSPHLGAPNIRARLYFAVADRDASCTDADCAALAATLTASGVTHQIERYPRAQHCFAVPDFAVFDEAAAEQHYARVLDLFAGALARPA